MTTVTDSWPKPGGDRDGRTEKLDPTTDWADETGIPRSPLAFEFAPFVRAAGRGPGRRSDDHGCSSGLPIGGVSSRITAQREVPSVSALGFCEFSGGGTTDRYEQFGHCAQFHQAGELGRATLKSAPASE